MMNANEQGRISPMEGLMLKVRRPIVIFLITAFCSCATTQVSQDYDSSANFSTYKTFAWLESQKRSGDTRIDNPLIDAGIRAAVDKILISKGYKKISDGSADFYVVHDLSLEKTLDLQPVRGYISFGAIGVSSRGETEYEEGTLIISVNDAKTKKPVWRGWATCRVNKQPTPDQTTETINKAVEKILVQFPPQ
jgi:hypothetical protein